MKANDSSRYIFSLLLVQITTIISSGYFFPLFLAGVVFYIFVHSLKRQYYYILLFSIFTFLLIESVEGFRLFTLTIISSLFYGVIIPKIKHILSSSVLSQVLYIILFYFTFVLYLTFAGKFNIEQFYIFILNIFVDCFVVVFFL